MNELKPKICKKCQELFTPTDSTHELCYTCWREEQPKCEACGKLLSSEEKRNNWNYCTKCFYKFNKN